MSGEQESTPQRKLEHIRIILNNDTQYHNKTTMLENVKVLPYGPSLDPDNVDISTTLIGKHINAPLFISGMTGGPAATLKINEDIAIAASKAGIPMGVGSQRAMVESPDMSFTYDMKRFAKNLFLIGNIGASELLKYDKDRIQNMLDSINADMLALHTNPGQESVQPEGNINFKGVYQKICELSGGIKQPVIVKEVGNGISKEVARKLNGKVQWIDTQGAGGTTWIGVETYRSKGSYGKAFWDWGVPTALSVLEVRSVFSGHVWASGGIRTPADIVKALALGAEMCGMAKPILVNENKEGSEGVYRFIASTIAGVKAEMAKLGFNSIGELKSAKVEIGGRLKDLTEQRECMPANAII
ncbi:MAG: type 2 isopentenyl-diphosphate Delta-isomerase [Candidatus Micrarchaeia archaeon]